MNFSRSWRFYSILFAISALILKLAHGFYVPGVAPQDFNKGDVVEVKVYLMKIKFRAILMLSDN